MPEFKKVFIFDHFYQLDATFTRAQSNFSDWPVYLPLRTNSCYQA